MEDKATAKLRFNRQSAQKVRLVANMIRGKKIDPAETILKLSTKKASKTLLRLLNSAKYNADQKGLDVEELKIIKLEVNEGPTIKRFLPRAQGRATPIFKRMSHITLELGS